VINRDRTRIRPPSRFRRLLLIAGGVTLILILTLRSIAVFWTDFLWFRSFGQAGVWRTLIYTRVWLVVIASLLAFALFWVNLWVTDRLSPRLRRFGGSPDEEVLERFQEWIEPRVTKVRLGVAAFFGIVLGLGAASFWEEFLFFRHGGSFGIKDPVFNADISRYVFDLPFYRGLFNWTFQLFVVIILVSAALHYLNGGIQIQGRQRANPGLKVHLSVLLAVLALLKAFAYQLDQWELLYSARGQVVGASFTDVNAQKPALSLLLFISILAAVILLLNLRFRGWRLPVIALGLWLGTSIIVGGLFPSFVQRFRVEPEELTRETPFVEHNIRFTRDAYGLAGVEVRAFGASPDLTLGDLEANRQTIDNIRLWDPEVLVTNYKVNNEIRPYYAIEDVDVDRYVIDGELTQVMVSARELDEDNIPGQGWVIDRLVYTHGFGAVVSPANEVVGLPGAPAALVDKIPPQTEDAAAAVLTIDEPRIYFSDSAQSDHVIVGTNEPEVDFPLAEGGETSKTSYAGAGGVDLGGLFQRAAFALRFGEVNVLISGQLGADSKVLIERNVRSRLTKAAPFLDADADPYLIVLDGRMLWVVDMYTTTDWYPYSTPADTSRLERTSGLPQGFNYMRNSVKATVDAFDGSMRFYVVDPSDPLIRAQQKIFPNLFTPDSAMPAGLREHLRYPADMFRIQSDMYRLYHVTTGPEFFSEVDPWQIARDPSNAARADLRAPVRDSQGTAYRPMLPYYLLMKVPGDPELSFILMQPFTPRDRPNMSSFLVAKGGPDDYGKIIDFTLPAERAQPGPGQVGDFINQDTVISEQFTLLGQEGSNLIQGAMLVVPVEESLLYIQPIYVAADSGGTSGVPELNRVIVSFDGRIEIRDTLTEALTAVFGSSPPPVVEPPGPGPEPPSDPGLVPGDAAALIAAAQQAFDEANAALRAGNLGLYADKIAEAESLIQQASVLLAQSPAAVSS
jgi:uncharacterized membrane protein (UPF0182 family)